MICPNCKQEIEDGSIYCEHCGQTIQIVPDYNALDDMLPSMVGEKPKPAKTESNQKTEERIAPVCKKKLSKKMIAGIVVTATLILLIIVVGWNEYHHSYGYYMSRGERLDTEKEYAEANKYYGLAMDKDDTIEARLAYGRNAYRLGNFDEAEEVLLAVIEEDGSQLEAFEILCKIYEAETDYLSIEELATYTEDEDVLEMLDTALILPPSFSVKAGKYDDDIQLFLSAQKDYEIYYTVDGSNPDEGIKYEEEAGILITDGNTTVRAVCKTPDGNFGFESEATYSITYKAPNYPTVSPDNGTFREETYITITPEHEGDRVYYTWDGSTPTAESALYTEPIVIPQGNNILSIIVINDHDLISDVLQCNYIYRP